MQRDLSGVYVFSINLIDPQTVTVTRHGKNFTLNLKDRFDRSRVYESRYIGFEVTEFKTRMPQSISRLVVCGLWEKAFYIDDSGREFSVFVTG